MGFQSGLVGGELGSLDLNVHGEVLSVLVTIEFLESLLSENDEGGALNEDVAQLDFREAETIGVGDVPGAAGGGGVDTSGATSLELHVGQNLLEVGAGGEERDLHHGTGSETSSQIGGASQDPAQMGVGHEIAFVLFEDLLDLCGGVGEASEDLRDRGTLLHGDDSHLILLIDPHKEISVIIGEDTTGIGPVAAAAGGKKKGGVGLLEQVAGVSQSLLLLLGHAVHEGFVVADVVGAVGLGALQGKVRTLQLTGQRLETLDNNGLELTTLSEGDGRGELEAGDGTAGSATGGENIAAVAVLGIELGLERGGQLGGIHVVGLEGIDGVIAVVAGGGDGVEQSLESDKRVFITGDETDGLDHRVTGVVETGLQALAEGNTKGGLLVLQLFVHLLAFRGLEDVGKVAIVLGEIGQLGGGLPVVGGLLLLTDIDFITTSQTDPLSEVLAGFGHATGIGLLEGGLVLRGVGRELLHFSDGDHDFGLVYFFDSVIECKLGF